ncbi:MAG: hypothetical protein HOM68_14645 [Gemmatimonadetes bacterium]|jgi:hypothetical protein|nr:hypothetical protein [Gemmatimonadota bacterium]MBT5141308.1 hypothetical protein [Gemmatimonadota bacterium]MBT5590389.1 hypothetical protein [Gemmatimonadota bacterium]MBT5964226.1 hypothetical protein [Gemmatimonadota bacterium]MBT7456020.1 hypothetical protein [Gemmatimonadota bacterium]
MSEIQSASSVPPDRSASASAPTATGRPAPESAQRAREASGPSRGESASGESGRSGRSRQDTEQARATQDRVSQLQQERAQVREQRQQARAERSSANDQARAERRAARTTDTATDQPSPPSQTTPTTETQEPTAPAAAQSPAEQVPEPTPPSETQITIETSTVTVTQTSTPAPQTQPAETQQADPPRDTTSGITITGDVRETRGAAAETRVEVEDSNVARERGVAGVRIDDPGEGVTFRFEDAGNGRVRATRFETQDGQQVATGSQTLSISGAGDTAGRGEAPGTLRFDDIGLELELDNSYTPGDLQFVELSSGASSSSQVSAGRQTQRAEPSPDRTSVAEAALNQALNRLAEREQQIDRALTAEESSLLALVDRLANDGSSSTTSRFAGPEDSRDTQLRVMAEALAAQGSPTTERVLQLLS